MLDVRDALRVLTPKAPGVSSRRKLGYFSPLPAEMAVILLSDFSFGVFFLNQVASQQSSGCDHSFLGGSLQGGGQSVGAAWTRALGAQLLLSGHGAIAEAPGNAAALELSPPVTPTPSCLAAVGSGSGSPSKCHQQPDLN